MIGPQVTKQVIQIAAHVARARHTVGDEHRKRSFGFREVNVHVPQARNQKLACRIYNQCSARHMYLPGSSQGRDAVTLYDNRHVRFGRSASHVNYCNVGKGKV